MTDAHTAWVPEHFIGGHPALDLSNAVYDRRVPLPDNELFKSVRDVGNWFRASGLAGDSQAEAIASIGDEDFVACVHEVREASYEVFDAIASDKELAAQALGFLFARAAGGLAAGPIALQATRPGLTLDQWRDADVVTAFLALLSIEAFFTLPRERLHACPRCGWLFVDKSRGGKRRWCNMRICGNREKVSRHREHTDG
jgi:predicted RNA-binding Zn ribbon-like protein